MIEKPWHAAHKAVLFSLVLGLLILGAASTTAGLPSLDSAPAEAEPPGRAASVAQESATYSYPGQPDDGTPGAAKTDALASTPSPSSISSAIANRLPATVAPTRGAAWTPTATDGAASIEHVARTVLLYIEGQAANDALLEIQNDVWVKSSNYHGVTIDGAVYYYAIVTHQSFDPLSRGAVTAGGIEIVTEIDDGDFPIVIYRITSDPSRQPEKGT